MLTGEHLASEVKPIMQGRLRWEEPTPPLRGTPPGGGFLRQRGWAVLGPDNADFFD